MFWTGQVWSFNELGFDFGYNKQMYGQDRQNSIVNRNYSANIASYFTSNLALELNYSQGQQITTENESIAIAGTQFRVTGTQNRVTNIVYGGGLRLLLTSRQARIRPFISVGYANQEIQDATDYTFYDISNNIVTTSTTEVKKQTIESVYGSFGLQIGVTQHFAIKGSVQTVFEAFKTERAGDNLRYMAGLTWIF